MDIKDTCCRWAKKQAKMSNFWICLIILLNTPSFKIWMTLFWSNITSPFMGYWPEFWSINRIMNQNELNELYHFCLRCMFALLSLCRVLKPTDYSSGESESGNPGCTISGDYTCGDGGSTTRCDGDICKCKDPNGANTGPKAMYTTTLSRISGYSCR